jgi:V/A-type H+-transporting ATPase subunit I
LNYLNHNGIPLIPYEFSHRYYDTLSADPDVKLILISKDKLKVRALVVGEEIPGQTPFRPPFQSISRMSNRLKDVREYIKSIDIELESLAYHKEIIQDDMSRVREGIEYEITKASMEALEDVPDEIAISWISGYVPDERLEMLKRSADENNWVMVYGDPSAGDRPPTLIRHKPAVRIIQPLLNLLGTVPGYFEYDISLSFLIFMCIFFAMIMGDAGYGLFLFIICIVTGLAYKKKKGVFPDTAKLIMLFSCSTMVWGSLIGSWFSMPVEHLPPFLHALMIQPFDSFGPLREFPAF